VVGTRVSYIEGLESLSGPFLTRIRNGCMLQRQEGSSVAPLSVGLGSLRFLKFCWETGFRNPLDSLSYLYSIKCNSQGVILLGETMR